MILKILNFPATIELVDLFRPSPLSAELQALGGNIKLTNRSHSQSRTHPVRSSSSIII